MNKKVELVYQSGNYAYNPQILILSVDDISFVSSIDENLSYLETKNGRGFTLFGKLRAISNRITEAERVEHDVYSNLNIRPSLNLKYKFNTFQIDNITMDAPQIKGFIDAFFFAEGLSKDEIENLYTELNEYTQEGIKNLEDYFWKQIHLD